MAELDIKKALEADPQNRYVKELIVNPLEMQFIMKFYSLCGISHCHSREVKLIQKNLKQLKVESNKRDATIYTNMFSRMTNDPSTATKVNGLFIKGA